MKTRLTLLATLILLVSGSFVKAQTFPEGWKSFDLAKYGMPFSIMAPASTKFDWDGDSEELYVEAPGDRYRLMISISDESPASLLAEAKEETVENEDAKFQSYAKSDASGYIAKLDYEGAADYELFYAFSKSGKTFVFEANPLEDEMYTEEDAARFFNTCQKASGK